jgi:pyruvate/2-oxoglutarate dehydrogenase complex dihydrolipoamide dehydrogenase (E3) component
MMLVSIALAVALLLLAVLALYVRRPSGDYDVVVIGGGSAGLTASGFAASVGARTLLIERDRLGGECTWTGCVPSKALLKAASVAHAARSASKYGLVGEIEVDLGRVLERVRAVQEHIYREADAPEVIGGFGVEVAVGDARFVSREEIEIRNGDQVRRVRFRDAIICTGSRARVPDLPGLDSVPFVTNESVFSLPSLPPRLLVLGAGPIGIELSQAFARLGSAVTVIARDAEILPKDAPELSAIVRERLEEEGVRFRLDAELSAVEQREDGIHAIVRGETFIGDALLVAVGRAPNVEELGLETVGVATNKRGIVIDGRCRTSNRHIYACGDVAGRLQFTHYGEHMAKVAVANAVLGVPLRLEREVIPWVTFTDPELAHVGARLGDLAGRRHGTYRFPYSKVDRAVAERDDAGWIHVHADRRGHILGATVVGASAGEVIAELALAMKHRISLRKIADTIHAYPTLALGARRVADQWYVQSTSPALMRAMMALRGLRGRPPARPRRDTIV